MIQPNIFLSVGATANERQELFVRSIEDRLLRENLIPNAVGRNKFSAGSPLQTILELIDECDGTLIIALERTYFPSGVEKRGGVHETTLINTKYPTAWNQIEAGLSYSKGHPLLLIMEEGLRSEGLLEKGYDWYVLWVNPDPTSLFTPEFNGVFASWKQKVEANQKRKETSASTSANKIIDPSTITVGELLKNLKPSNFWAVLVALAGLLSGAFIIGQHFAK